MRDELSKIPQLCICAVREWKTTNLGGNNSKGVTMIADNDGDYDYFSREIKDDNGNFSAVRPGLGGKPSLIDIRILEDLGYEIK